MAALTVFVLWVVAIFATLVVWRLIVSFARAEDGNEFIRRYEKAYKRSPKYEAVRTFMYRTVTRYDASPDLFEESEG